MQAKMERMTLPELPVIKSGVSQTLLLLQAHRAPLERAERPEPQFSLGAGPPPWSHTKTDMHNVGIIFLFSEAHWAQRYEASSPLAPA